MGIWNKVRARILGESWEAPDSAAEKDPPEDSRPGRNQSFSPADDTGMGKVMVLTPGKYVDAGKIADCLLDGYAVAVNLESASREAARRIVDFLSGAAYGRDGQMVQIGYSAYLLLPAGVKLLDGEEEKDPDGTGFEDAQDLRQRYRA